MAIPKKGSRSIEVDGIQYRYKVTGNDMVIDVFVEHANGQGQKLSAVFKYHNMLPNFTMKPQQRAVTPLTIRQLILHGLSVGWQPDVAGKSTLRLNGESIAPLKD